MRVALAGSRPIRRYVNDHFEAVKTDVRNLTAAERAASEFDARNIRIALDRLEEAIGFLGMQLTVVRTMVEDHGDAEVFALTEDSSSEAALVALGFERSSGIVWRRVHSARGAEGPST